MKKNNFLTKAFTLLFVLLFNLTGARAIVTHTVYDGTAQNTIVPVQGDQVGSNYIRSQFIIPQDQLEIMAGGEISNMIFYATQDVVNWYAEAQFDVYVGETDETSWGTNPAYKTWGNFTKVYSGNLAINGHQLIIDFTSDFLYSGEHNLLIGIYQTSRNSNNASTFVGTDVTNGSVGGYFHEANNWFDNDEEHISYHNFIPKTTFVYTPGFIPYNVTASTRVVGSNPETVSATVNWTGDAERYEVRYRTKRPLFKETFDSGIPSDWTVWKNGEAPAANYSNGAFTNGWGPYNGAVSSYSWYQRNNNTYIVDADNWLISPKVELGGILKFDVKISPWHDLYEVKVATVADIASANVNDFTTVREMAPGIAGTEDFDLKDYSGQEGYIAIHHKNKDGYYLTIDNFELSAGHSWKYAETEGNETTIQLPRLIPYMEYEYVVTGIKTDPVTGQEVRGETVNLSFTCPPAADIILPDNEDNESLIYDVAGLAKSRNLKFNAYLENRTFKDNGVWNTFALPFDVTVAGSPFEDALIYTVNNRSSVDNTGLLTLRIDNAKTNKLAAGTPYLITWEEDNGLDKPTTIVFSQVTFKNETYPVTGSVAGESSIVFKPNFNLLKYTEEKTSILFLSNNTLYNVGNGTRIKPQRAYFERLGGGSIRGMVFEIEDDETAIESVNGAVNNDPWYDLNGRKLTGKPAQKGIYIINGKKTIIK